MPETTDTHTNASNTETRPSEVALVVGILNRAALLDQATPERNPVWIEVRGGRVVRSGLVGIDDPKDPKAGMVHANATAHVRAVASNVQQIVGNSESTKGERQ